MSLPFDTLRIRHIHTREERELAVEHVNESAVYVRWPMNGVYRLDLESNELESTSSTARARGSATAWGAFDILTIRKQVAEHFQRLKDVQSDMFSPRQEYEREVMKRLSRSKG